VYDLSVLLYSSSIDPVLNDEDQIEDMYFERHSPEPLVCVNEFRHALKYGCYLNSCIYLVSNLRKNRWLINVNVPLHSRDNRSIRGSALDTGEKQFDKYTAVQIGCNFENSRR
jgi:hypothetical protein